MPGLIGTTAPRRRRAPGHTAMALVIAVVAACAVLVATAGPARAEFPPVPGHIGVGGEGGGINFAGGGGTSGWGIAGAGAPTASGGGGSGGGGPVFWAITPTVSTLPDGTICFAITATPEPTAAAAWTASGGMDLTWLFLVSSFPACPRAVAGATAAGAPVPPSAVAGSFWSAHGQDLLARPRPHIAPGWALTGKLAYLQTGSTFIQHFDHATPLGTLSIEARGTVVVDWGDGTGWQGPYAVPGAPWPSGTITHAWDGQGRYDVTVAEDWSATWSLQGQSGSLSGLRTVGTLPGFPVRQLEAVRNR